MQDHQDTSHHVQGIRPTCKQAVCVAAGALRRTSLLLRTFGSHATPWNHHHHASPTTRPQGTCTLHPCSQPTVGDPWTTNRFGPTESRWPYRLTSTHHRGCRTHRSGRRTRRGPTPYTLLVARAHHTTGWRHGSEEDSTRSPAASPSSGKAASRAHRRARVSSPPRHNSNLSVPFLKRTWRRRPTWSRQEAPWR